MDAVTGAWLAMSVARSVNTHRQFVTEVLGTRGDGSAANLEFIYLALTRTLFLPDSGLSSLPSLPHPSSQLSIPGRICGSTIATQLSKSTAQYL
jgi:hypothetical protein